MTLDEITAYLPHIQATLNASSALLLGMGYYYIRNQNHALHRSCMLAALMISALFMVSYLTYHARVGYIPFAGAGIIRPFYFTVLASHVILAVAIVPMVIVTVVYAIIGNFRKHPHIARWTLPLWFYVSISGVLIYILGFHIYAPEI